MAAGDVFPFAAIVGQDDLKLALLLNAVSPAVGGVLIQGEKGNAKSTAARALAELLPPIPVVRGCPYRCDPEMPFSFCPHCQGEPWKGEIVYTRPPFVELPLGTSEDRLLGHLDLEALLNGGKQRFYPGLLAQAHRGILYVDEVNLLDDQLVDNLLDAAASGWNRVEREGFSIVHPARFILVGTMNPEEGELRPQLKDRFGLSVQVSTPHEVETRVAILERRLEFAHDPVTFFRRWKEKQEEVALRLRRARQLLPDVRLPRERIAEAAQLALSAGTEGMRADLSICEAAKAMAAYCGRDEVTSDDILLAARFALFHRAKIPWEPDPGPSAGDHEGGKDRDGNGRHRGESALERSTTGTGGTETVTLLSDARGTWAQSGISGDGDPKPEPGLGAEVRVRDDRHGTRSRVDGGRIGTDVPNGTDVSWNGSDARWESDAFRWEIPECVFPVAEWSTVQAAPLTERIRPQGKPSGRSPEGLASKGMKTTIAHPAKGRTARARPLDLSASAGGVRIDWPKTVLRAFMRRSGRLPLRIRGEDVWRKTFRLRRRRLTFFLVDASGSMAGFRRMAQVKGAVLALAETAYRRRDWMALATFRNGRMEVLQPPTRRIDAVKKALEALVTGGDTPLALGLNKSREWLRRWCKKQPNWRPHLILFSDGRVNTTVGHGASGVSSAFAEVLAAARLLAADGISGAVVDTEGGWFRFGGARRIAEAMHVPCYTLEQLTADEPSGRRSVVG